MAKLGSLNHFYTPGSFPDSRFIQLKSHSSSLLGSNTSKYLKRHSVARTLTWVSKFSHSNNFLRRWHCDTTTYTLTHTCNTLTKSSLCDWAAPSDWKVDRHPHPTMITSLKWHSAGQLLSLSRCLSIRQRSFLRWQQKLWLRETWEEFFSVRGKLSRQQLGQFSFYWVISGVFSSALVWIGLSIQEICLIAYSDV